MHDIMLSIFILFGVLVAYIFICLFFQKRECKPNVEGMEKPKALGYLNPLWRINIYHKDKQLTSVPFLHIIHTYLKDYGYDPDGKTDPSIIVGINTGQGEIKMPLFLKENKGMIGNFTAEEARKKGLIV